MRSLATSRYTADQVEAQLRSGAAAYTSRFELLDPDGNVEGELDGVIDATVDFDVERPIVGSLDLDLLPDDRIANALLQYRVKPWFGVRMPDDGIAEYSQGVYVWLLPDRDIAGLGAAETWTVQLGDNGHLVDLTSPGTSAFRIEAGTPHTEAIGRALNRAGFYDQSGIVPSDEVTFELLSWGMRRNVRFWTTRNRQGRDVPHAEVDTQPETMRTIIDDLRDGIGYDGLWWDGDGRARCEPSPDLSDISPDVSYATQADGIMLTPVTTAHDWGRLANRVFARAQSSRGEWMEVAVADANDLVPNHPLAQANCRRYIDTAVDVQTAGGAQGLEARARRELYRRLTGVETVETPSLAWPVHEAYDVVGIRFDGDREFDTEQLFREKAWSLKVAGDGIGEMTHTLRRVVGIRDL